MTSKWGKVVTARNFQFKDCLRQPCKNNFSKMFLQRITDALMTSLTTSKQYCTFSKLKVHIVVTKQYLSNCDWHVHVGVAGATTSSQTCKLVA